NAIGSGRGGLAVIFRGLQHETRLDAAVRQNPHGGVAAFDAFRDVGYLGNLGRIAHDRADDFQCLPRMLVVIRGVQLQPAQAAPAARFRELRSVAFAIIEDPRPVPRRTFHRVIDGSDACRKRTPAADFLAPVRQYLGAIGNHAAQDVLARYTRALGPVQPILGVVLFDTNVAHQPAACQIVTVAAAVTGLQEALCHVTRKTFDDRPNADHEIRGAIATWLAVAHDVPQFMLYHCLLDEVALANHVLRPLRVAFHVRQWASQFKTHTHDDLLGSGRVCSPSLESTDWNHTQARPATGLQNKMQKVR